MNPTKTTGNKTRRKRKVRRELPNRLFAIPNADKQNHEKWFPGRKILNFPHPYRGVLLGPPHTGKSTTMKHIVMHAYPEFEEVIIIHCDGDYTNEYKDLGDQVQMLDRIPDPQEWEGQVKTLVLIDDIEFKVLSKQQKSNLNRLFGYVSTHKNISVLLSAQDPFNVPPCVRRCSNLFVLYKCVDTDSLSTLSRKVGFDAKVLNHLFRTVLPVHGDSLWIDLTIRSPCPYRKNGFDDITNYVNRLLCK